MTNISLPDAEMLIEETLHDFLAYPDLNLASGN